MTGLFRVWLEQSNAGFSIVKYFGNTTAGATVGHGLSYKPEWIFIKNLTSRLVDGL